MSDGTPAPVLFTHYGEEWIRGSEWCLLDLLRHLDRARFVPRVWCNAETLAGEVRALDVPVEVSPFVILLHWDAPRFAVGRWLGQVRAGLRLVRRHGIRLLHANSAAPNQWLLPVARTARVPLLVHLHVPYLPRDRVTLGLHQASLAVGVTRGCIEGLIADGMPASRTRTIHNGVDPERVLVGDARGLRRRLGIPQDTPVLARAGSLIARKGVDLLLRVLARLDTAPAPHLLVIGSGPERSALEALARRLGVADRTHFLGYVESVGVILRDAVDVLVSPARVEGFGLTVIEAGLVGKPVVVTRTTGMDEIVTPGESGLLVPVEDEEALAVALRSLLASPALRERLGEALRRRVQERFLVSRYVREFEEAYGALLASDVAHAGWAGPWASPAIYSRWLADGVERRLTGRPAVG